MLVAASAWGTIVTPIVTGLKNATDSVKGAVELSTDTEAVTGTATDVVLTPANLTAKLKAGLTVLSDSDGVVLTSADWGKFILMTGAGEVQLPDAGASDIGKYIIVMVRDASEQAEIALTDGTEAIVLASGTALTAGNEANMPTAAGSQATLLYLETGKWYVRGGTAALTDGGAAD